ncbi:MAG: glycosyl hydrolase family protein [Puniceicoccaceae bacterium]|nr:MAG: glycosyl hydrolase family protein [Puniceicoccaceae bacterium]
MKNLRPFLAPLAAALLAASLSAQSTTTWLNLTFNNPDESFPAWGSPDLTGVPGAGGSVVGPTLPGDPGFDSSLFPTPPTNGYLALTSDASAVTSTSFWTGWASNVTLATLNSPYTAGGFGQPDLSKVSLTARVRATGLPPNGAVVILEIRGSGDNPDIPITGYRRIRFEPVFMEGSDWVTIGGTLDDAGLTAAQGSRYSFPLNAAQYSVLIELNGFNQFGSAQYVAYNSPTGPSNNGRKNPGFGFTGGIRVEVDEVRLVVTDAATDGFIDPTTPDQLLRNGNFNTGSNNWTFFEGAYVSEDGWSEDGSLFALIPGWAGSPYAGFMQNQIAFDPANGDFFTATFRANFEANYQSDQTIVAFMSGNGVTTFLEVDITEDIGPRRGQWHTYRATFRPTPAQLAAMDGRMSFKIQPLGRTADGTPFSSALIDDVVLTQRPASEIGPRLAVRIAGAAWDDGATANLVSPVLGKTTPYPLRLVNEGAETLTISGISLGGGDFALGAVSLPIILESGESRTLSLSTSPTTLGPLADTLTVTSNDQNPANQTWVVGLAATAVTLSDTFDGTASLGDLGWFTFASTANLWDASTFTQQNGAMVINVDSSNDDYPWMYIVSKPFASPGPIDLAASSLEIALRAQGIFPGLPHNKVQVRLESLTTAGTVTGALEFGEPIDETTAGAPPGSTAYFTPDGTIDRIAILLPEGGDFTVAGGSFASAHNSGFDPNAPVFRLVIHITDFEFDLSANNIVEVDYITIDLGASAFRVANGGFEQDVADFGPAAPPSGWQQFPVEGVSKNLITAGDAIFNASLGELDPELVFTPYAGERTLKVYGQNFYVDGVWQGPSQTGTVYQSFPVGETSALAPGAEIHARGAARIYGVDPLTGGSSFRFGFQYLDAGFGEIGRDVVTLDAASPRDRWLALAANGAVPAEAVHVRLILEFVQNAATDAGAVYLDDVSVGFGHVPPTVLVGDSVYELVWSDEFNGTELNSAHWTPEFGNGVNGWGNWEVQNYTDDPRNLRVENGRLIIEAHRNGSEWTSARIKTQDKRTFQYGKIEVRAKLPSGIGPWPAAWMLGENFPEVGWPQCGEIDIMEWRGTRPDVVSHATHSPSRHGGNAISVEVPVTDPSDTFNTYAVVWEPGLVSFSVNGVPSGSWSTADTGNPFEQPFFILLNLAIGGTFLGHQIDPALTSARYEVDYVRVYQAVQDTPPSGFQQYLVSRGLPADLAFGADADGHGVPVGMLYAFGAPAPRLGPAAAVPGHSGGTLTYAFDLRDDPALTVTPVVSTDLVVWAPPATYSLDVTGPGPEGFLRHLLTIEDSTTGSLFVRFILNYD